MEGARSADTWAYDKNTVARFSACLRRSLQFRDFLVRGNIVELAVAFVLGVAFGALVTSFVDNLLMPVVAMIHRKAGLPRPDLHDQRLGVPVGSFLTDLIAFAAVAAAVFFFVVRPMNALMNRLRSPVEEGLPDEMRRHRELLAALSQIRTG